LNRMNTAMIIDPSTVRNDNSTHSHIKWRRLLLLHRVPFLRTWHRLFPVHDVTTARLMRYSLDSFEAACDRAEAEAAKRPIDPKLQRLRCLLDDDVSLDRAWSELNDPRDRPTSQASTIES